MIFTQKVLENIKSAVFQNILVILVENVKKTGVTIPFRTYGIFLRYGIGSFLFFFSKVF